MTLHWKAVNLTDGSLIAELPDLSAQSELAITIGQYESATLSLPLSTAPPNWTEVTRPKATALIATLREAPVWGGTIVQRPRNAGGALTIPVVTLDGYFADRYVTPAAPVAYLGIEQNSIAGDLVTKYAKTGIGVLPGVPFRINTTTGARKIDASYDNGSDVKVYDALQALSAQQGGPEWSVSWEVTGSPQKITPVFNCADRLGKSAPAGLAPQALFTQPGCVIDWTLTEDWSQGNGANVVTATASGQGPDRTQGQAVASVFTGQPAVEVRWTPNASVVDPAVLANYAASALPDAQNASSLALVARADNAPVFGRDWFLGDDVAVQLDPCPQLPNGLAGTYRAVGVKLTDTTVTPVLYIPDPFKATGS